MKAIRVLFGVLSLFFVVAVAGVTYLAAYLDEHRALLELGVSRALGREVRIEEGVSLHWSMTPSVALRGLWVGNPDWASGAYFLRAGRTVIRFDLMSLLSRRLEIVEVALQHADLQLETGADGRHNWTFTTGGDEDAGSVEITLQELAIDDSSLKYRSSAGEESVLTIGELGLDRPEIGRLDLEGSVSYRDVPVSVSGSAELKAGAGDGVRTFAAQIGLPDAALAVTGEVSGIHDFSRLQLDLKSDRLDLRKWLSLLWPAMPFDASLNRVSAQFDSNGDALESLIGNARGELNVVSAELILPGGGDASSRRVELKDLSAGAAPDQTVRVQTALVYRDHSYQVDLDGGTLIDLFAGGSSWDRLKLDAKGRSAGRPLEIAGELGPWSAGKAGGLGLDLRLRHEQLRVGLKGTLASFDSLEGSRFAVKAAAPSLARLSPWIGVAVPESPPFEFSSNIAGRKQQLRLTRLDLAAGASDIHGELTIPLTRSGRFEAVLESRVLDLRPYLGKSGEAAADGDVPLLDRELPSSALRGIQGSVAYKADRLKAEDLDLKAVKMDAALTSGHLRLNLSAEDERLTLDTDLKPAAEHWRLAVKHKGKLEWGRLVKRDRPADDRVKPPMDIELELQGTGRSLGAILDSADGSFLMVLGAGEVSEEFFPNLPLDDVLFTLLSAINPGGRAAKPDNMECAVVQLDIAGGVATSTQGLALRTGKFNVLGGGALKLRTGEIDLHFKTASRKGLGISLLGIADRLIRLTGTLDAPKVGVKVGGAVAYGAAAWATGGLSVLYDTLFHRLTAFSNPCDAVLKGVGRQP